LKLIGNYAYAVARLHSIENKMPDMDAFLRLTESGSTEDAIKQLADFGYIFNSEEMSDYDDMLQSEMIKTIDLLKRLVEEHEYFKILLSKDDYHNLKVLSKSEALETDHSSLLSNGGVFSREEISVMYKDRDLDKMSAIMKNAVYNVMETMSRTGDPQLIDIIYDRAYFEEAVKTAKELNILFISGYIILTIDLLNIRSYIRIKKASLGIDFLRKVIIPGGSIQIQVYEKSIEGHDDEIIGAARYSDIESVVLSGIGCLGGEAAFSEFEKAIDDRMIEYIKPYRYSALGIEPIISHLIAKELEIKNIRILLSGISNGLEEDIIKERLRKTYA
jgi:V/A-type H+/Na+-transporting ATPase subunit C